MNHIEKREATTSCAKDRPILRKLPGATLYIISFVLPTLMLEKSTLKFEKSTLSLEKINFNVGKIDINVGKINFNVGKNKI